MSDQDNGARLAQLLEFDPGKEPGITKDAFADVLKELAEERREKAKAKAREVIVKASELRKKMVAARREFDKQEAAFNKELGKLLGQLQAAVNGKPQPPEGQEDQTSEPTEG